MKTTKVSKTTKPKRRIKSPAEKLVALEKARSKVLATTAAHFNKNNRSIRNPGGEEVCLYYKNARVGCAVGRLIKNKALCKKLDKQRATAVSFLSVFNMLPNYVKKLGQDFLSDLQYFHDYSYYWDEKGLTSEGKTKLKAIKLTHNLP